VPGPADESDRSDPGRVDRGDVIEVLSTDAGSLTDIPAWVTKASHELVSVTETDGATSFVVRKMR
jgi:tRNA 2-thiouridine synthesizing protein A